MRGIMTFIICTTFCNMAIAGGLKSNYIDKWGSGSMKMCLGDTIHGTKACIGASENNSCNPSDIGGDAKGIIMMVARKITDTYAIFCPTQVEVKHDKDGKTKGRACTTYRVPGGYGETMCVTLYQPEAYTSEGKCDAVTFNRDTYSSLTIDTSSGNIEGTIPMFDMDQKDKCGHNGDSMEHDIILAIVDWTPGGHGAFVQPLIVASKRSGWKKKDPMRSWPELMPADGSNKVLACKVGYRANADKTNCEPIDMSKCNTTEPDRLANLCTLYVKDKYDSASHSLQYDEASKCYKYLCSTPGYAFVNTTDYKCDKCITDARNGVNPRTGECVKCSGGKVFSATAANSEYCVAAKKFSKQELLYGPNKTKGTGLENQCWTLFGDDYVDCMNGRL